MSFEEVFETCEMEESSEESEWEFYSEHKDYHIGRCLEFWVLPHENDELSCDESHCEDTDEYSSDNDPYLWWHCHRSEDIIDRKYEIHHFDDCNCRPETTNYRLYFAGLFTVIHEVRDRKVDEVEPTEELEECKFDEPRRCEEEDSTEDICTEDPIFEGFLLFHWVQVFHHGGEYCGVVDR